MTKVFLVTNSADQGAIGSLPFTEAVSLFAGERLFLRAQSHLSPSDAHAVFIREELAIRYPSAVHSFLATVPSSQALAYIPLSAKNEPFDIRISEPHQLPSFLMSEEALPAGAFALSRSLINEISSGDSMNEIFMKALALTISDSLERKESAFSLSIEDPSFYIPTLSERAATLRAVIENSNIEELFPSLAWAAQQSESAASAYHMLAAHFLHLRDFSAAKECLECSDQFEDSPRALALRGMIAKDTGETLGAVANMVSSLQQYELQKHTYEIPKQRSSELNIEVINSSLVEGLEALNRKDNEKALQCFTEAVFTFDPFYKEFGLDR